MRKYIAPTPDLMLPGITSMPLTDCDAELPYLHRDDNAQATRDAIEKYGYPKLGTHVRISALPHDMYKDSVKSLTARGEGWIVGYTKASFSSNPGDFSVTIAYPTKQTHLGVTFYEHDGVNASWIKTDDGRSVSDQITMGATQYLTCKGCGCKTPAGRISLGYCPKARCTVMSMRANM